MSLLEIANTYYAAGDLELSIRHYRSVLEQRPDHHDCRAWLAATLAEAGRRTESIVELERLVADTKRLSFHFNIAMVYNALAEDATDAEQAAAYTRLGNVHLQLETGVRREFVEPAVPHLPPTETLPVDDPLILTSAARALKPETAWILR